MSVAGARLHRKAPEALGSSSPSCASTRPCPSRPRRRGTKVRQRRRASGTSRSRCRGGTRGLGTLSRSNPNRRDEAGSGCTWRPPPC
eukprot:1227316-Pyramimonas_sp.AAC.1